MTPNEKAVHILARLHLKDMPWVKNFDRPEEYELRLGHGIVVVTATRAQILTTGYAEIYSTTRDHLVDPLFSKAQGMSQEHKNKLYASIYAELEAMGQNEPRPPQPDRTHDGPQRFDYDYTDPKTWDQETRLRLYERCRQCRCKIAPPYDPSTYNCNVCDIMSTNQRATPQQLLDAFVDRVLEDGEAEPAAPPPMEFIDKILYSDKNGNVPWWRRWLSRFGF